MDLTPALDVLAELRGRGVQRIAAHGKRAGGVAAHPIDTEFFTATLTTG